MAASQPEPTEKGSAPALTPGSPDAESSTFHTALAHLYRGEMHRMATWRMRLDTTSHWAIILSIGLTTFALGSSAIPHYVMLLALAFNTIFMLIEGRRYQHLLHSKWRLGILERNHFAVLLSRGSRSEDTTWREQLAADLRHPRFAVGLAMGTRLRLRKNYLMIMCFVTVVWIAKLFIHPASPRSFAEFHGRLAVEGFLPAWFVALTAASFVLSMVLVAASTPSEVELERRTWEDHLREQSGTGGPREP
jgi:uncharacterized membrane protein